MMWTAGPLGPFVGLCGSCRHCRVVDNTRGSRFYLCGRSKHDSRFRKYPSLPVLRCSGYEAVLGGRAAEGPREQ